MNRFREKNNRNNEGESETSDDECAANLAFGAAKARAKHKNKDDMKRQQAVHMLQTFFDGTGSPESKAAAVSPCMPTPVEHIRSLDAAEVEKEEPLPTIPREPNAAQLAPPPIINQQAPTTPKRSSNWDKVPVRRKKKLSPRTIARRLTRKYKSKSFYHSVAEKNRLGSIHEDIFLSDSEGEDDLSAPKPSPPTTCPPTNSTPDIDKILSPPRQAKRDLLQTLNQTMGDTKTPAFQRALLNLLKYYVPPKLSNQQQQSIRDRRRTSSGSNKRQQSQQQCLLEMEGIGISAGKPTFPGCIGRNDAGDPMYKLGTMSFDMFCPTQLVVSVQGTFVVIDAVDGSNPKAVEHIPKDLLADVRFGHNPLRSYNIVTPFTIEPWKPEFGDQSPNKGITHTGIRGVMTTYGFILPYPKQIHRFSVWFSRGTLELVSGEDDDQNERWFQIFDNSTSATDNTSTNNANTHKRTIAESGKLLAAKLLMGASTNDKLDADGRLSYTLTRPKANHIDLIYLDKTLQVLRASSGTVYVHVRLPGGRKAIHKASVAQGSDAALLPPPLLRPSDSFVHSSDDESLSEDQENPAASSRRHPNNTDVWILPNTINAETQLKVSALMEKGKLKQAADLLQRTHSESDLDSRGKTSYNQRFRRTTSENDLDSSCLQVRKRVYAAEA